MDYEFKRAGWHWAALEFAEGLKDASSYPLAYLYSSWLALSGHMIGRRAWMYFPRKLYPNMYVCLVGPSAQGRKSTALALSYEAVKELSIVPPLRTITTQQGLLQAMESQGGHSLIILDEFSSMSGKTRMDYGSDLMQRITELYDCPDTASTNTRKDPITVYEPYLSILSASTVEWIQSTVSVSDMMGGLGNRMTFIVADERETMPWPGRPEYTLDWTLTQLVEGELVPTDDAKDLWQEWFRAFDKKQRQTAPFLRTLAQRVPEKVWKTAMTMTIWDGVEYITDGSLEMAIDWGEYMIESIYSLAPSFEDKEKQVFTAIQEGYDSKQTLYSVLRTKMSPTKIQHALKNLEWMGAIVGSEEWYACQVDSLDKLEL